MPEAPFNAIISFAKSGFACISCKAACMLSSWDGGVGESKLLERWKNSFSMGYSGQDYSAAQAIDHSILKYPMVLALQTADMMASKLLEDNEGNRFDSVAALVG